MMMKAPLLRADCVLAWPFTYLAALVLSVTSVSYM